MSALKSVFVTIFIFIVGAEGRKIDELEQRLAILEQKFGFQVYENTLMKAEINSLKNIVADIAENITYIVRDNEDNGINKESKSGESAEEFIKMKDMKQNLNKIVKTTVLLLDAFKNEKEERIKQDSEIENLKKWENVHKNHFKMLNKTLENTQVNLKTLKDTYKVEKEGMQIDIEDLKFYRRMMDESLIKVKLDNNENEITKISSKCDRIINTLETNYSMALTRITEMSENLKSKHVSFSARVSESVQNLGPWKTLVFDDLIINNGKAYSGSTGLFTAPLSGVYVFYTHILAADRSIEMSLQHNGRNKLWLYAHGSAHGADSNMIVLELKKGDEVKVVKNGPYGSAPFYVHHVWSTFSGYMIYQT